MNLNSGVYMYSSLHTNLHLRSNCETIRKGTSIRSHSNVHTDAIPTANKRRAHTAKHNKSDCY
jgi:hypothetical protein